MNPDWARHLPPAYPRVGRPLGRRSFRRRGPRAGPPPPSDRRSTTVTGGSATASSRTGPARSRDGWPGRVAGRRPHRDERGDLGELVVAHVAALRLGLVVVPVNGAYREREIAHVVGDCTPRAAVVDDRARGEAIFEGIGPSPCSSSTRRSRCRAVPNRSSTPAAERPGVCSATTSGTTGTPKGAHGSRTATRWRAARHCGSRGADGRRSARARAPLFHVHGLGVGLHGTLLSGASAVSCRASGPTRSSTRRGSRRDAVSSRADDVRPIGGVAPGGGAGRACASACPVSAPCPPPSTRNWRRKAACGCWSGKRHDRDPS